jgi:hypothetical protein
MLSVASETMSYDFSRLELVIIGLGALIILIWAIDEMRRM